MAVLTPQQRNALESAVKQSRKIAQSSRQSPLIGGCVSSAWEISHLSYELAYETWHKIGFGKDATISILETVQSEGKREVKRRLEFYNLDAIIAVGFRVDRNYLSD